MSELNVISDFSIFKGISIGHLKEITDDAEMVEFAKGEAIFKEGDEASTLYGVLSGEVELVLVAEDKILKTDVQFEEYTHKETEVIEREVVVDTIGVGEIFGWSALTPSGKYTSAAVCARQTKVIALPASNLKTFFSLQPQIGYPFMEKLAAIISKRFANRTDKLIEGWIEAFAVNRI